MRDAVARQENKLDVSQSSYLICRGGRPIRGRYRNLARDSEPIAFIKTASADQSDCHAYIVCILKDGVQYNSPYVGLGIERCDFGQK